MRFARYRIRFQRASQPVFSAQPLLPICMHIHRGAFSHRGRALCRCVKLEILEARQNQLATVPSGIGACRMLIELDLAQNQLVMLAPELAGCAKLTILDISGNGVTAPAIPPNLLKATSLAVRARTAMSWLPLGDVRLKVRVLGCSDFSARAARSTNES